MKMKDLKSPPTGTQEIKILYILYRDSEKYNVTYKMKIIFERQSPRSQPFRCLQRNKTTKSPATSTASTEMWNKKNCYILFQPADGSLAQYAVILIYLRDLRWKNSLR